MCHILLVVIQDYTIDYWYCVFYTHSCWMILRFLYFQFTFASDFCVKSAFITLTSWSHTEVSLNTPEQKLTSCIYIDGHIPIKTNFIVLKKGRCIQNLVVCGLIWSWVLQLPSQHIQLVSIGFDCIFISCIN